MRNLPQREPRHRWATWFDGLTSTTCSDDTTSTTISGFVFDQSALHGLLAMVRDLGATLISVTTTDAAEQ